MDTLVGYRDNSLEVSISGLVENTAKVIDAVLVVQLLNGSKVKIGSDHAMNYNAGTDSYVVTLPWDIAWEDAKYLRITGATGTGSVLTVTSSFYPSTREG